MKKKIGLAMLLGPVAAVFVVAIVKFGWVFVLMVALGVAYSFAIGWLLEEL